MGDTIDIGSREYKLLLEPSIFPGAANEESIVAFWSEKVRPLISGSGAEGETKLNDPRVVLFFETENTCLAKRQFTLRSRRDAQDDTDEITLKLRTPDLFVAANYFEKAREIPDTKFEEDIAPLAVATKGVVAPPQKRTTYSRFSVSSKIKSHTPPDILADAFGLFPMLKPELTTGGQDPPPEAAKLEPGKTICEWVFEKDKVDLGPIKAKFALTLWYMFDEPISEALWQKAESGDVDPAVAEISFKLKTSDGSMSTDAAMRAAKLFEAMQVKLPMNKTITSKTAFGLPGGA